jgi:hypothetical protein
VDFLTFAHELKFAKSSKSFLRCPKPPIAQQAVWHNGGLVPPKILINFASKQAAQAVVETATVAKLPLRCARAGDTSQCHHSFSLVPCHFRFRKKIEGLLTWHN